MEKITIVTDSNAGMSSKEAENSGVRVIPMPFFIDGEEFFEEISLSHEQFYAKLREGAEIRTTQPTPGALCDCWKEALESCDKVVYIPMTSGLSGSAETGKRLAADFDGRVLVADNKRISVTQKESVCEAVAMARIGKSAQEIVTYLEETAHVASIYIALDTLTYLKKGGRITPLAAAVSQALRVKPILFSRGEKFDKYAVALTAKQAAKKMLAAVEKELYGEFDWYRKHGKMTVSVAHTQNDVAAAEFADEIRRRFPEVPLHFVDPLSLSVSCHIGPGALAIALAINSWQD